MATNVVATMKLYAPHKIKMGHCFLSIKKFNPVVSVSFPSNNNFTYVSRTFGSSVERRIFTYTQRLIGVALSAVKLKRNKKQSIRNALKDNLVYKIVSVNLSLFKFLCLYQS